jgi:hypothetical protein
MFAETEEIFKVIFQALATIASIAGLIWAIKWAIRSPKLRLSLLDSRGDPTRFGDSRDAPPAFFYHLRIRNIRKLIATNVRVKVIRLLKHSELERVNVAFESEGYQQNPLYLIWAAQPSPKPYLIDVLGLDEEACNLGYVTEQECVFKIDALDPARSGQNFKWPPNFQGFLTGKEIRDNKTKETMRVELVALAENARSRSNTLCLNITWDGQWHSEAEEMQKHLVVSTVHATPYGKIGQIVGRWQRRLRGEA